MLSQSVQQSAITRGVWHFRGWKRTSKAQPKPGRVRSRGGLAWALLYIYLPVTDFHRDQSELNGPNGSIEADRKHTHTPWDR